MRPDWVFINDLVTIGTIGTITSVPISLCLAWRGYSTHYTVQLTTVHTTRYVINIISLYHSFLIKKILEVKRKEPCWLKSVLRNGRSTITCIVEKLPFKLNPPCSRILLLQDRFYTAFFLTHEKVLNHLGLMSWFKTSIFGRKKYQAITLTAPDRNILKLSK